MSKNQVLHIREIIQHAQLNDVQGIFNLLKLYSDRGILLPRPEDDIYNSLRDFYVAKDGDTVIACGALLIYTKELGEIRSLAVDPCYVRSGLGYQLVGYIEKAARNIGLTKLMALTYVGGFFQKMGFQVVEMSVLPEKVWGACIRCHKFRNCDEIAVLKCLD